MLKSLSANQLNMFSAENILEAFLAGTNDGFMVLDKDFRVITFNEKFSQYHQFHSSRNIVPGAFIEELIPAESFEEVRVYLKKAAKGETIKFSTKYNNGQSKYTWFDVEYHPLISKSGEIIGVGVGASNTTDRHQTEEKLRQSEDLFKTLIQNSTDAFQLADSKFELLFISSTIKNILGFETHELTGKNGLDMVHTDEREKVVQWFKKVKSHKEKLFSIEYRVKNKDDQWIWIENYGSNLLDNPNVQAVVMNLRNIQAKKIADFALIQAEQRLSLLLNNTEESFIILNSRLKIIAYNRAAQKHSPYFYTQELQSGISVLDLVDVREIEKIINLFERVFGGEQVERETTYLDDNKTLHIFSHIYRPLYIEDEEISGVFITSTDITKRKQAELQVKESEIRFKTIIQESFDAVLITDEATDITYSSPSIKNVLGYSVEELTGTKAFNYMHPDDLQPAVAKFAEVMLNPNSEKNIDVRMRNSKGEYVWIELKGKNMFNNNYVQGILVSLRDITSRKKAEEIISLSEQRFKGLVQSGADMIWIINESSELLYASPTVQSIMGVNSETRYGQSVFKHVHVDDSARVIKFFNQFVQSGYRQVQVEPYRFVNDVGDIFWVESTITNFLSDPSIKGIVLNSRDVTDRRELTEQLAVNSARLKTAQKLAKIGYLEYDFKVQSFFFSDEVYEILGSGYAKDQLDLEAIERNIHPDDRFRVKQEMRQALIDLVDCNTEYRMVNSDGTEKVILAIGVAIVNESGKPEKFRVVVQDITDSKIAIMALQTMEGRFKSLFENSIDGVLLTAEEGNIISANPSICRMLGYTQKQITLLSRADLINIDAPENKSLIEERKSTGSFIGEIAIRHKNGSFIPAEITSINMIDAGGKNCISTIVRDITEKKKIEEEQKVLTGELLRNNQDLQQFSFITSHNLRAPVANLISLLSLFNRDNPADDFNAVLVEKFEEATLQLNSTLNDLVNVLVIKSNNNIDRQVLRFSEVFKTVKLNIENLLLEQNGIIETDFSEVDEIEYNKIHIDSIFLNLISNAIRYRSTQRSPHIKIRSYRQDHWVVVSFEDNGLGMDLKRYGDRLFGLYQRFHVAREGKGLGLYMTKSQVMAMGGKIEVESEPEKGTIFKVFFKS
jgi:PAS domain S-box-containing protein